MEQRYQVIIVGGGPVGVALAVDLGLHGISCGLVERYLTPQQIPKGQNLTQRSMEHFYFWGIADELRAARLLPKGYPIGGITAYGDLMSDHWYSPVGRESVRSYYLQDNERLPQYRTEEVLRARLTGISNVTTNFGWSAETIEQDDNGVRVTIAEEGGSGSQVLNAEYVVGCDGARSTVRESLGIARRLGFRPANGSGRVQVEGTARGSKALSGADYLSCPASRPERVLAFLRTDRRGGRLFLPRPGAEGHYSREL